MKMNIWIDDMRNPPRSMDQLIRFFDAEKAIFWISNYIRQEDTLVFYLDHDLGLGLSGYDFAKWFVEWNYERQLSMTFHILSNNPIGAFNIRQLFTHYGYKEF